MKRSTSLKESIARSIYQQLKETYSLSENLSTSEYVRAIQNLLNELARKKNVSGWSDLVINGKWNSGIMNPAYANVINACKEELEKIKPDINIASAAKKGSYLAAQFDSKGPKGVTAALKAIRDAVNKSAKPKKEEPPKPGQEAPKAVVKTDDKPKKKPISVSLDGGFLKSTKHKPGKEYRKFGGNLRSGITIAHLEKYLPAAYKALMDPDEGGDVGGGSSQRERSDIITQVYIHTTDKVTPEYLVDVNFQSLAINAGRYNQILFKIGRNGGSVKDYRGAAPWARDLAKLLLFGKV